MVTVRDVLRKGELAPRYSIDRQVQFSVRTFKACHMQFAFIEVRELVEAGIRKPFLISVAQSELDGAFRCHGANPNAGVW